MFKQYAEKVRSFLGGFRNQDEVELARQGFARHLTPAQCAQYIVNNR